MGTSLCTLCNNTTTSHNFMVDNYSNKEKISKTGLALENDSTIIDTHQNYKRYSMANTDMSSNPMFNIKEYDTEEDLKQIYCSILNFDNEVVESKENYDVKSENHNNPEHLMISGGSDKLIKIWNYGNECIYTLKGHEQYIRCLLAISESIIASGGADKTIKIWSWKENLCIKTLIGHKDTINSIITLNDSQIVSAGLDRLIKVWDWKKEICLNSIEQEFGHVNCLLRTSPVHFISGGYDLSIELWDSISGKCEKELKGHSLSVTSLICLGNGNNTLASGSWDNTIKIWNIVKEECTKTLRGHTHYVQCLILLNEKKYEVISCSFDKTIRVWNWKEGACIQVLKKHTDWVHCLVKINDNEFASGGHDKKIILWNNHNNTKIVNKVIEDHSASVHCLSVINLKLNYFNIED